MSCMHKIYVDSSLFLYRHTVSDIQYKINNVMYNFYTEKTSNFILNPSKILFQTKWHLAD